MYLSYPLISLSCTIGKAAGADYGYQCATRLAVQAITTGVVALTTSAMVLSGAAYYARNEINILYKKHCAPRILKVAMVLVFEFKYP